jgi:hypothetical protein
MPSEYKQIKNGTNTQTKSKLAKDSYSQTLVGNFEMPNFASTDSDGGKTKDYSDNFYVDSNRVKLNVRQSSDIGRGTAKFKYSIVKWGTFRDTYYGSSTLSGNNTDDGTSLSITLSSSGLSNVCLRVDDLDTSYPSSTWGNIYVIK